MQLHQSLRTRRLSVGASRCDRDPPASPAQHALPAKEWRSHVEVARRNVTSVDPFDDAQQPRCPECGTVLQTAKRGFVCRACDLAFVDAIAVAERIDPMR